MVFDLGSVSLFVVVDSAVITRHFVDDIGRREWGSDEKGVGEKVSWRSSWGVCDFDVVGPIDYLSWRSFWGVCDFDFVGPIDYLRFLGMVGTVAGYEMKDSCWLELFMGVLVGVLLILFDMILFTLLWGVHFVRK